MTPAQYDAVVKVFGAERSGDAPAENDLDKIPAEAARQEIPVAMAVRRKLEYVRSCLRKLRPGTRTEVIRSIESLFRFSGGIREQEVEQILSQLQKEKYLTLDAEGMVSYKWETTAEGRLIKEIVKPRADPGAGI